ncbi:MAG: hypothetical protein U0974_01205 [Gemmatimonadales bacterium]|nr:hypothetical protein [Gemmatimonadales bacterium]MDZ4388333.1 hypothetical protein [Gemmatimonadales bacterium]
MKSPEKVEKAEEAKKDKKPPRHRSNGRGSLRIDLQTPGVGRIAKASGVSDPVAYHQIMGLLASLRRAGRRDILRAVKDGRVSPLQLLDQARVGGTQTDCGGISLDDFWRFEEALRWWEEHLETEEDGSHRHRRNRLNGVRRILNMAPPHERSTVSIKEIPRLATEYRTRCVKKKMKSEWGHTLSYLRSFVEGRAGSNSPTLRALNDLTLLPCKGVVTMRRPQSPTRLATFLRRLDPRLAGTVMTMALTGMGPEEYFANEWAVREQLGLRYIYIAGMKRERRTRVVPWVCEPLPAECARSTFNKHLRSTCAEMPEQDRLRPYDLRRTYAVALKRSGVSMKHHADYLGHGPRTVTNLYQIEDDIVLSPEQLRDLDEDARHLQTHFNEVLTWAAGRSAPRRAVTPG